MDFIFSLNTELHNPFREAPIKNAVSMLERDMHKCLTNAVGPRNAITLVKDGQMAEESYQVAVADESRMTVTAGDDLGFVYGLLSISEALSGHKALLVLAGPTDSGAGLRGDPRRHLRRSVPAVRYRGWFLNDEVLLIHWKNGKPEDFPWRMAFEALLRCGGNMVIPGTDKNSRLNANLASEYGLWLTHHHAEPLGAEIFARAYPDLMPSYSKNPECFHKLWEEAVLRQKDQKVIWALGFRGQGDCPFWERPGEESFDTPKKNAGS